MGFRPITGDVRYVGYAFHKNAVIFQVAIKIVDLTCIKEEYARRNLHREPRVMSKLRHPCIAALYETMMVRL